MIIDGVKITADFKADKEELAAYVKFVKKTFPTFQTSKSSFATTAQLI